MEEFEFIGPSDQPALLAISTPEVLGDGQNGPDRNGLQSPCGREPSPNSTRYNQVNYQMVVIEENFAGGGFAGQSQPAADSESAHEPAAPRDVFSDWGQRLETLNTMQAFAQSVHCVINYSELPMFSELVQKTMAENDMFLATFRDTQRRVYQKAS